MKPLRSALVRGLALCSFLGGLTFTSPVPAAEAAKEYFVYVGTYTGPKSKGIYAYKLDVASGKLAPLGLVAETPSPAFLAVHPNGRFLYAANEVSRFEGKPTGSVSAFAIDPASGQLSPLNQVSSGGAGPCFLTVDSTGGSVLVANYGGGSVAALPLKADGRLGDGGTVIRHTGSSVNPARQKEPHAHSINVSPDNRFAFAADLGLDQILSYRLDPAKAGLSANDPPFTKVAPGSGPRHFAFHPEGRHAYVINEMLCTVTAFDYDPLRGTLTEIQTLSTLPAGQAMRREYSTAEVRAHPSGKFLYGSNRGHDTIAVYRIGDDGKLTLVENAPTLGKTPRNFAIDPTGAWLFAENQSSDSIVTFRIDPASGRLTPTGQVVEVGSPVCIRFVPVK